MSNETAARWYLVTNKAGDGFCLVEANNLAQAFRRVAKHYCDAKPASAADAIKAMEEGADRIPMGAAEPPEMPLGDPEPPPPQTPPMEPAKEVFAKLAPSTETF